MPSALTITSSDFFTFVAGSRAKASQVNTCFSMWRGHHLPMDPNTVTSAHQTYDLGASDAYWRNLYLQNFPNIGGNNLSGFLSEGPHGLGLFPTTGAVVIKKHDGTDLSTTNYGIFMARSSTIGASCLTPFTISANVTLTMTGNHWNVRSSTPSPVSLGALDVIFLNESSTARWGLSYYPGRTRTLLPIADMTTGFCQASPKDVHVNVALTSPAVVTPAWWFRASMNDTSVANSCQWSVISTQGAINYGSSDGIWRHWAPTFGTGAGQPGWRASGTLWTAIGGIAHITYEGDPSGFVSATPGTATYSVILPVVSSAAFEQLMVRELDNNLEAGPGLCFIFDGSQPSQTMLLRKFNNTTTAWTGGNVQWWFDVRVPINSNTP